MRKFSDNMEQTIFIYRNLLKKDRLSPDTHIDSDIKKLFPIHTTHVDCKELE